ncbi:hypothetical protein CsSME_00051395 [Camellia sinensis var. sinensis]
MEVMNKFITIKRHIEGAPQESDFELKTESISLSVQAGSNDVIVKTIYLSMDPYQLNRMKSYSSSQKAHSSAVGIIPGEDIVGLQRMEGFSKYVSRRMERKCLSLQLLVLSEIWLVSMQSCLDAMLSAVLDPNKRWNCLKRSLVLMMHSTTKKKQISSQLSKGTSLMALTYILTMWELICLKLQFPT